MLLAARALRHVLIGSFHKVHHDNISPFKTDFRNTVQTVSGWIHYNAGAQERQEKTKTPRGGGVFGHPRGGWHQKEGAISTRTKCVGDD